MSEPFEQPVEPFNSKPQEALLQRAIEDLHTKHRQAVLAIFNSPEGDHLMSMWEMMFLKQAVIIQGQPIEVAHLREGRNEFIRAIKQIVDEARSA